MKEPYKYNNYTEHQLMPLMIVIDCIQESINKDCGASQ